MKIINKAIDRTNKGIELFSIQRYHIFFIFIVLGDYLVVFPLLHFLNVSQQTEAILGNYTNIVSAGVSMLTLAEARKIKSQQNKHSDQLDKIEVDSNLKIKRFEH